jgi:hypothetical protein
VAAGAADWPQAAKPMTMVSARSSARNFFMLFSFFLFFLSVFPKNLGNVNSLLTDIL